MSFVNFVFTVQVDFQLISLSLSIYPDNQHKPLIDSLPLFSHKFSPYFSTATGTVLPSRRRFVNIDRSTTSRFPHTSLTRRSAHVAGWWAARLSHASLRRSANMSCQHSVVSLQSLQALQAFWRRVVQDCGSPVSYNSTSYGSLLLKPGPSRLSRHGRKWWHLIFLFLQRVQTYQRRKVFGTFKVIDGMVDDKR